MKYENNVKISNFSWNYVNPVFYSSEPGAALPAANPNPCFLSILCKYGTSHQLYEVTLHCGTWHGALEKFRGYMYRCVNKNS